MYASARILCGKGASIRIFLPIPGELPLKQFKRLSAVLLAIVLVSALGCAGSATQESTGEFITDSWITTKVKASLAEDRQVKATEVNVETFKGVVQLSGFVGTRAEMSQAVRIATGIRGVTSVKNDIRIK